MKGDLTMNKRYIRVALSGILASILTALLTSTISLAQTAPPPAMGEETKGQPAIPETSTDAVTDEAGVNSSNEAGKDVDEEKQSVFGTATIKESRRESGQVYRIELEHSAGAKQVIEENDSDGSIESTNTDIDDTPNLPKWTLGSW